MADRREQREWQLLVSKVVRVLRYKVLEARNLGSTLNLGNLVRQFLVFYGRWAWGGVSFYMFL